MRLLSAPLGAQEIGGGKEFLTDYEIDVLRDNQKPKERIAAYLKFASLRLELVDQLSAVEEAGRGAKLHRNLEEYSRIIEAVDTVIDDRPGPQSRPGQGARGSCGQRGEIPGAS